jgi:hypothetical protein
MIAAIVVPGGVRSMEMMRARLVSGRAADLDDARAGRARDLDLWVLRAVERVAVFGLDLNLVIGSSEIHATPSAAPPQPRPVNHPAGQDPEAASAAPSHHSNAPIRPESQSILSKIVAPNRYRCRGPNWGPAIPYICAKHAQATMRGSVAARRILGIKFLP